MTYSTIICQRYFRIIRSLKVSHFNILKEILRQNDSQQVSVKMTDNKFQFIGRWSSVNKIVKNLRFVCTVKHDNWQISGACLDMSGYPLVCGTDS